MIQWQITIFDFLYPKYKIKKPIRLIELFAGYGSQYLALKYLGANAKHYKICEWAAKSIQAYNDLHIQDYFDYSDDLSDDNILKFLVELGVSINYNEPATREQLKRQNFRKIYNNIIATNNLVNIQNAKGEDFKIVDKDQYDYIMTYSFPCQDLSLAGKGRGMADTSTRSGMLWEVERILNELKLTNSLPQILLMENVPQVHGSDNVEHFNKWQLALENMGYKNYFQDLIATDYGIPQTRNRCFMISILGDYSYNFPKPIPLELKLKDLLEKEVDEKYYLSDKMTKYYLSNSKETENYIEWKEKERLDIDCRTYKEEKNVGTITTTPKIKIITNAGNKPTDNFVYNKKLKETLEQNKIKQDISFVDSYNKKIRDDGLSSTITTRINDSNNTFIVENKISNRLRIRKLTPCEVFRLMGVKDEDYYKVAKNQSNSSLYHLGGDSIVVDVLMAIFKEMIEQK